MHRCWVALSMFVAAASSAAMPLFEAPTHLRFSAREVSEAARGELPRQSDSADACDERCQRIRRIWARLLPAALEQPHGPSTNLRLITAAEERSAYAHANGTVVFPAALVDALDLSDEQIAFMLAHEMIHVLLEHEREILTAADAMLRPDVRRSAADVYGALDADLGLTLKTSFLMQAAEFEADALGLQLAALAGFDPDRQLGALDKLLKVGAGGASVVATHPSDVERLERIRTALPIARSIYRPGLVRNVE